MLRPAGFFRELGHGDGRPGEPSIQDYLHSPSPQKAKVVAYLLNGHLYAVAAGVSVDIFRSPERHIIGGLTLLTDGIWLWPSDLPYYVQGYDVAIAVDFAEHMRAQGWTVPTLTSEDLRALRRS